MTRFSFSAVRLIMAVFIAVAVGVPAATWDPHTSAHLTSAIEVDGHHHHEDGRIVVDHDHGPDENDRDGGHDHGGLPQHLMDGTVFAAFELTQPAFAKMPVALNQREAPPDRSLDPDRRPPRTV